MNSNNLFSADAPIAHQTGYFSSFDGLSLYYQHWWSEQLSSAMVVMVHGLGGHSDLFGNVVKTLAPQGYHLYALDLRGNGRSPGKRGHINRWLDFRHDLNSFWQYIIPQCPNLPQFMVGHSLGGTIVLDYVLHSPQTLEGIIVSNPAIGVVGVSPLKFFLGKLFSQIWSTFSQSTGISLEKSVHDPALIAHYKQDSLRHDLGTARLATEYIATTNWIKAHGNELNVPLLMLQSGLDTISPLESSHRFFENVPVGDKTWKEYPQSYHEIYDDLEHHQVLADLSEWLKAHLT